ncbi:signal peptidase I [Cytobacillus horneckiae]|uniref:Signal peptidase I n=1 Tax=Cytobacillus horneckiae TaxID=549687 RepID=A0A2N0ZHU4_9BACI|nr:signal peptidase I [Cytobacillus horneckiae]NRG47472.1 signal peptidase I [Bacillus sp. CRN 9]MBN6886946.1 signal peptidase I [Cytobacillus horneckiae]MCM3177584.1 signal peptidase I [Cytobacillus horneckiae]MEC1157887.1 signal peptidase I [Cytobacillus horneckiae]MED2937188.1 signal peptidase I [Cytobacillus horneckiae]
MKKILKIFSSIITAVLFINVLALSFIVISSKASGGEPLIFGHQLKSVLSGSMEPTFQTGSIIAVSPLEGDEKKNLKAGDVITFQTKDDILVTHRITDVQNNGSHVMYETKGDNNNTADIEPVLAENVTAVYSGFTIPYAGYFIDFAQSKEGSALLLILPGVFLLFYAGVSIYQGLREIDKKTKEMKSDEKTV